MSDHHGEVRMHLTILEGRLFVARMKKEQLYAHTRTILSFILFRRTDRFFSITETPEEISFILDEISLKEFPEGSLEISKHFWRAVQIDVGSVATTGIVHSLADPLAKSGISIYYLSTYTTDFVLVPEQSIREAIDCLQNHFTILTEGLDELENSLASNSEKSAASTVSMTTAPHPIRTFDWTLALCNINIELLPSIGTSILQILFFPSSSNRFFSYTETHEDEISLICDRQTAQILGQEILGSFSGAWKIFKVEADLGFEETGIVAALSGGMAQAKISLLYISTFSTDFVLVEENTFATAIDIIKKEKKFIL